MNVVFKKKLQRIMPGQIWFDQPLARHTVFGIGGPADILIQPKNIISLQEFLKSLSRNKIDIFVLGNGSNILIRDGGIRGIVLRLRDKAFCQIRPKGDLIYAGAGVEVTQLLNYCLSSGLSGIEFLAGIPATVGGALVMNAGAFAGQIADVVSSVTCLSRNGEIYELPRDRIKFGYRRSSLKNYIVIAGKFKLKKSNTDYVRQKIKENFLSRKKTQDMNYSSAGCVFKNLRSVSAGILIDRAGLKGLSFGDAAVSLRHANFIVNRGRATAKDILRLIRHIKHEINNKFNIKLQTEIRIMGVD
ncbi:MAG: UDP-N-acetylmuramate dehydrogenase [Candidatus Omnitrophota bacterium]